MLDLFLQHHQNLIKRLTGPQHRLQLLHQDQLLTRQTDILSLSLTIKIQLVLITLLLERSVQALLHHEFIEVIFQISLIIIMRFQLQVLSRDALDLTILFLHHHDSLPVPPSRKRSLKEKRVVPLMTQALLDDQLFRHV